MADADDADGLLGELADVADRLATLAADRDLLVARARAAGAT